jgi:Leucine-rich repeat (LRR) protein
VPNLNKLNLASNQIENCASFTTDHSAIKWIDLSSNQLKVKEDLAGLAPLENLETIILNENPLNEEIGDDLKKELLILLDGSLNHLKMLNEEEVTQEDKDDAKNEKMERIKAAEEAERERLEAIAAEEAEKAAAAAEAAANAAEGAADE